MKAAIRVLFVVSAMSFLTAVHAAEDSYYGVKAGFMMPDGAGMDDAINVGVVVGAPLTELKRSGAGIEGSISVEGEFTMTLVKGDININIPPFPAVSGDWDVMTLGGFGVFRSAAMNKFYFKAKAGMVYSDTDFSISGVSGSGSDTDIVIGLGGGYKLGKRESVEVELTLLNDMDFLSVAYHF